MNGPPRRISSSTERRRIPTRPGETWTLTSFPFFPSRSTVAGLTVSAFAASSRVMSSAAS